MTSQTRYIISTLNTFEVMCFWIKVLNLRSITLYLWLIGQVSQLGSATLREETSQLIKGRNRG